MNNSHLLKSNLLNNIYKTFILGGFCILILPRISKNNPNFNSDPDPDVLILPRISQNNPKFNSHPDPDKNTFVILDINQENECKK